MALVIIDDTYLKNIANALRAKLKKPDTYKLKLSGMSDTINEIKDDIFPKLVYADDPFEITYDMLIGVDKIKPGAFYGSELSKIILNYNINTIGERAFYNCTRLESVALLDAESIGYEAFYGCTALPTIAFSTDCLAIAERTFANCTSLASISGIKNVTSIGEAAFANCSSLASITIPDGVSYIADKTFQNCTSLKTLTMPAYTKLYNSADTFQGCGVEELTFTKGTELNVVVMQDYCAPNTSAPGATCITYAPWYRSLKKLSLNQGILNLSSFLCMNSYNLTEVSLPVALIHIGECAFANCTNLESLYLPNCTNQIMQFDFSAFSNCHGFTSFTIPDSVMTIPAFAFKGCKNLESINIGRRVTKIELGAFDGCSSLKDVYYHGTEAEWNKINISSTNNDLLLAATIHFSENSVVASGTWGDTTTWAIYEDTCDYVVVNQNTSTQKIYALELKGTGKMGEKMSGLYTPWDNYRNSIETVYIADGITSVHSKMLANIYQWISVIIPGSVKEIESSAFSSTHKLSDVYYTGDIDSWCNITFASDSANPAPAASRIYFDAKPVTALVIPSTVTEIKDYAFVHFDSVTSVIINNNTTSIGREAFRWCYDLSSVVVGPDVIKINERAFENDSKLVTLILRNTQTICELTDINAFSGTQLDPNRTGTCNFFVYVPKSMLTAYETDSIWSTYAAYLRAIEDYPEIVEPLMQ